jgi:hypothetical protein
MKIPGWNNVYCRTWIDQCVPQEEITLARIYLLLFVDLLEIGMDDVFARVPRHSTVAAAISS